MRSRFACNAALVCGLAMSAGTLMAADDKTKDKNVVVTGCLTKDAEGSTYVITEDGTSRKVTLSGGMDVSKHVNHKVKLTGDRDMNNADKITVTKVEHISDTCAAR